MPSSVTRTLTTAFALAAALVLGAATAHAQQDALVIEKEAVNIKTRLSVNGTATASKFSGTFEGMGAMPVGAILMWSGSPDKLPAGWVLCDGRDLPGGGRAPALQGLFIVGYDAKNAEYAVKNTGGEARHALTIAEMPSHSHGATTGPAGAHTHPLNVSEQGWAFHNWVASGDPRKQPAATTNLASAGQHTHSVQVSPTGGGQPFENRPPYYVLAYIMYTGQ